MAISPNVERVSHDLDMRMVLDNGSTAPMPCTFDYVLSDPFAVSATFRSANASVSWVFGRELLKAGLARAAGDGDIRLIPMRRSNGDVLQFELTSPDGRAVIEGSHSQIANFLQMTYDLLPEGLEWTRLNLDHELARLLKDEVA